MSEYVKKILVFDELDNRCAVSGKKLSGVLKLEKCMGKSHAEVYVSNFNRKVQGEIQCVLSIGEKKYTQKFDKVNEFSFTLDDVSQCNEVSCVLVLQSVGEVIPFAFATNVSGGSPKSLLKNITADTVDITKYEEFVCATDNYFEREKVVKEKVEEFDLERIRQKSMKRFKPVETLGQFRVKAGENFFLTIKEVVEKIFETYPPCDELNDGVDNSFWVKVPFNEDKYFVVGLVTEKNKPKRLCYGVPGTLQKKPADDSFEFLPTKNSNEGFWMLYQNADTGDCERMVN